MTLKELMALDKTKLRWWVILRVRGQEMDPPPASRRESPADFIIKVYNESHDLPFAHRLEKAVIDALTMVGKSRDLFWGHDVDALEFLSRIVVHIRPREAYPVLLDIANRGTLGGHQSVIDPRAEHALREAINAVRPHDRHPLPLAADSATEASLTA